MSGSRRPRLTLAVVALSAVATLTACTQSTVAGTPLAAPALKSGADQAGQAGQADRSDNPDQADQSAAGQRAPGNRVPAPPGLTGASGLPTPGQCFNSAEFVPLDCAQAHEAESISSGQLPADLPAEYPGEEVLRSAAVPPCRAALTDYLGGQDADATRLQVWAFWPSQRGWRDSDRWLLCSVIEVGSDGQPVRRTGSLRNALADGKFNAFQRCSAGSPSKDAQLTMTGCDQPHLGEALPSVLPLGKPTDPVPSAEAMNNAAREHCDRAMTAYLGASGRQDVWTTWRMPNAMSWAEGFTNITCYAEAVRLVTGTMRGIGTAPLPG
ncbi:septum formation family protein [Goodfellowiella coeruleoviolacea]|uniref:Septum formation n=1 Tax=Goodfellowiella coeruleoviolacea TaxID=334858 RepID=A0AAE3GDD4_9PSEU|nr:septum formation family protein [Goodfellowiella coeruleoviolacea]MCP2166241.1 Septum formation [Goodfellowiella coeruleoviolacea]